MKRAIKTLPTDCLVCGIGLECIHLKNATTDEMVRTYTRSKEAADAFANGSFREWLKKNRAKPSPLS